MPGLTCLSKGGKRLCRNNRCHVFFGAWLRHALFYCCEDDPMDINYFKDILFDLVNESDELDPYLEDIECDDRNNLMTVIMKDGERFTIHVSVSEN